MRGSCSVRPKFSRRVTVSIGAAERTGDSGGLAALASAADHAMYRAKAAGRNQIRFAAQ